MPRVVATDAYNKQYAGLTRVEQKQANKTMVFLATNPRHPSLQSHKLQGTPYIEVYVNMDIRIIYESNRDEDLIVLQAVGHHDILRKF